MISLEFLEEQLLRRPIEGTHLNIGHAANLRKTGSLRYIN